MIEKMYPVCGTFSFRMHVYSQAHNRCGDKRENNKNCDISQEGSKQRTFLGKIM
jgi:hypothetical protein